MPTHVKPLSFFLMAMFTLALLAFPVFAKKHTLLVVLAHGDDIVSIAPLVAKSSAEGNTVYYATFTGLQDPTGEEGSRARNDMDCGLRALGVREKLIMRGPAGEGPETIKAVAHRLIEVIEIIRPDVIITWGPDGLTGHPRHIMVGNIATRVFQQAATNKYRPRKLYYIAYPESRFPATRLPLGGTAGLDGPFGTVNDAFVTTMVDGSKYIVETDAAIACFKYPDGGGKDNEKWRQTWARIVTSTLGGRVHLRLVMPNARGPETSIFKGL